MVGTKNEEVSEEGRFYSNPNIEWPLSGAITEGPKEAGGMGTQPPLDFTVLATRLVNSSAEKNFISLAEVLELLDPDRVDVAVFVRGVNAHLNFVGAFRSISFPRVPQLIASPPDIARIAQVLAEAAR
jgi:hypothetical protein